MIERATGKRKLYGRPEKLLSRDEIFASVVDHLFRRQQIHLLVGASGSGKSRWGLEMLDRIRRGQPIFGHGSTPIPFIYVTGDRDFNTARGLIFELGMNPDEWPIFSLLEDNLFQDKDFAAVLKDYILPQFPAFGHRLIFIEAITMLVGDNPDYHKVKKFLQSLLDICHKHDVTIIGTGHSPKMKQNERYELSRENVLGSVAWGGVCDTMINFEFQKRNDPLNPGRRIVIWPHSYGKPEVYHMAFEDDGRLHMREDPAIVAKEDEENTKGLLKEFLKDHEEFLATALYQFFVDHEFNKRTAQRLLKKEVERGRIVQMRRGTYKRRERDVFDLTGEDDSFYKN